MKVLLVVPASKFHFIDPPLGMHYLKAALDGSDLAAETRVLDLNVRPRLEAALDEFQPDVVGVTATKPLTGPALEIARAARARLPGVKLMAGGPQPSIQPETFLPAFDLAVRGEGEATLVETLRALAGGGSLAGIAGITYRGPGGAVHNPPRRRMSDLDALPFSDASALADYPDYAYRGERMAPLMASRGCPYTCIFCNKEVFGHRARRRSPGNILAEMQRTARQAGVRVFQFRDDIFTLDQAWTLAFCAAMSAARTGFDWLCNTRVDRVDEDLLERMAAAGCRRVSFGVETGDPALLELLNKGVTVERILAATRWAHQYGMRVKYYLMVGIPGQDAASVEMTQDLLRQGRPDEIYCSVFLPFPGTAAWRDREKLGIRLRFDPDDPASWERAYYQSNLDYAEAEPPIETNKLSADEIKIYRGQVFRVFNEIHKQEERP